MSFFLRLKRSLILFILITVSSYRLHVTGYRLPVTGYQEIQNTEINEKPRMSALATGTRELVTYLFSSMAFIYVAISLSPLPLKQTTTTESLVNLALAGTGASDALGSTGFRNSRLASACELSSAG